MKILKEHDTTPQVQCLNCEKEFCGGATRIGEHIMGDGSIGACTCTTDSFLDMKLQSAGYKQEAVSWDNSIVESGVA